MSIANARRIRRSMIERPEEWAANDHYSDTGKPYVITHTPTGYGIWVATGLLSVGRYDRGMTGKEARFSLVEKLIVGPRAMKLRKRLSIKPDKDFRGDA